MDTGRMSVVPWLDTEKEALLVALTTWRLRPKLPSLTLATRMASSPFPPT